MPLVRALSSRAGLCHDPWFCVPTFRHQFRNRSRRRIDRAMTLPELRFMCDSSERDRCLREAKRRVLSLMSMRQRGFLFVGFCPFMAILFSRRPFHEMLILGTASVLIGQCIYWRLKRNHLRRCLREVIRQTTECCTACGYSLKSRTCGNCPECGSASEDQQKLNGGREDQEKRQENVSGRID